MSIQRHSNEPLSNKSQNATYFTRGQQDGGSGSDCLFISGYYSNENALFVKHVKIMLHKYLEPYTCTYMVKPVINPTPSISSLPIPVE